jgi:DNA (cytosine-5)-methyltransferase 1
VKPILLDLMCGAGGAAKGYQEAGYFVIGVDLYPHPNYCGDQFIQADVLDLLSGLLQGADVAAGWGLKEVCAAHASPPCQAHTDLQKQNKRFYPELIGPTRELLKATGLPYVIENVEGAPLIDPITLCGTMFPGLRVLRHRLFEANFPLEAPAHHPPHPLVFTYDKRKPHYGQLDQDTSYVQVTGGGNCTIANARDAMGIDWMNKAEINEAIPPAYTRFIGEQLAEHLSASLTRRAA